MEEQCSGPECSTESSCSGTSGQSCPCGGQGCPGCNSNINPEDFMANLWHKAAFDAMYEVKKDKIKEKMLKAYGDIIDKGADATLEAFSKKIMSLMDASKIESEFRSKLSRIMDEAKRK